MTTATIALQDYLRNLGIDQDKDFLQENIRIMSQMLMELEVQTQTEPPFMDDTHGGAFGTGDGAGLEMVRRIPTGYCFNRYDLDTG